MFVPTRRSFVFSLALLASSAAALAADPPAVAILPPALPFEHLSHEPAARNLVEALRATLAPQGLRLVERAEIQRILDERRLLLALGDEAWLVAGRGVGADLLVQPRLTPRANGTGDGEAWSLRLLVIDPEKADVLSELVTVVGGDRKTGPRPQVPQSLPNELVARLTGDAARLAEVRRWTPVGVLFFGNTTTSNDRLDGFSSELADALHAAERPGIRMLRFPAVETARGEEQLALGGLTAGHERWQDVARWWVWGEYQEVDWEGRPPAEAGITVRVHVWDGAHEPVVVEERGTAGDRAALAARVAKRVSDRVAVPSPARGKPLSPAELAKRLVAHAEALTTDNIGGEWGATQPWLNRWRQSYRLLDLARFVAPDDRAAALAWLRTRFREDMAKTAGRTSGTQYFDEPRHHWQLRRAEAWGQFADRFGLTGEWSRQWPQRRHVSDNRTATSSVASMYLRSAMNVLDALPKSEWDRTRDSDRSDWPMKGAPLDALLRTWTDETVRRAVVVADAKLPQPSPIILEISQLVRLLRHDPAASRRLFDQVLRAMNPADLSRDAASTLASHVRQVGKSTGDEAWTNRMLARLPATATAPATRAARTTSATRASPAPGTTKPAAPPDRIVAGAQRGINLTERYHVQVAAVAAWEDAWMVSANGQDLGTPNLDVGNFLFLRTAKDGEKFRRIEKSLGLTTGVAAMAQDGPVVWMAGAGDGIAQMDLATVKWKRWGLKSGLPIESFADVDVDPDHVAVAVSGENVSPPVIVLRKDGRHWISHTVQTFRVDGRPFAERVAATRDAVLVSGDEYGVLPFASLYSRRRQTWVDVRKPLVLHLAQAKLDVQRVKFGEERFNVLDAVALPQGGFLLLHALGATWIDDAGTPQRTTPWGEGRQMTEIGQGLCSRDRSRAWIAGTADPEGPVVVELPLTQAAAPVVRRVASVSRPLRLAQNEEQLLVGGVSNGDHVVFLRLRDGSISP